MQSLDVGVMRSVNTVPYAGRCGINERIGKKIGKNNTNKESWKWKL